MRQCWYQDRAGKDLIEDSCEGKINISEDYPDIWTYYCTKHGHFEDWTNEKWEKHTMKESETWKLTQM